jgi:hypothetical protein
VPVGTRRIDVVDAPKAIHRDSATADYVVTVAPNANGVATGADRDTTFAAARLIRRDGRWRVLTTRIRSAAERAAVRRDR